MTANQIAYAKVLEDQRSHRENERISDRLRRETERSNRSQEAINVEKNRITSDYNSTIAALRARELTEAKRHNRAQERMTMLAQTFTLNETARHNRETEALAERQEQRLALLQARQATEAERANMAAERIRADQASETARHNRIAELLQERQMQMNERIAARSDATARLTAAQRNATTLQSALINVFGRFITAAPGTVSKMFNFGR